MLNLRSFIFFIVIIDFSLMPMFHIYGLPWKPGFLIIGALALSGRYNRHSQFLFLCFFGLILSSWIGAIYQGILYYSSYNSTIFYTTSILLGFLGYCYGYNFSPTYVEKTIVITVIVIFLNLSIAFFWDKIPFLVTFYNLQVPIQDNWISSRNPGIFTNPNISALGINLLLLFLIIAYDLGLLRKNKIYHIYALWLLAFVANMTLFSKNQTLAFVILTFYLWRHFNWRVLGKGLKKYMTLSFLFIGMCFFLLLFIPKSSFNNGLYIFTHLPSEIHDQYLSSEIDMENRGDRRVKYLYALKAFSHSPIWGSGFDRAPSGIFSEVSKIGYHSDWSYIFVAGGISSMIFFLLILNRAYRTHTLLILPFFLPGLTNSFMFAVQFFCLFGVFWGVLEKKKVEKLRLDYFYQNMFNINELSS